MNDIEFETPHLFAETRLERGRRLRKLRRRRTGLIGLTGICSFSLTLVMGTWLTGTTYSVFTDSDQLGGTIQAAADFCQEAEDTHQNGEEHKEHPPGEGEGHCKPHENNGTGNDDKGAGQGGAPYEADASEEAPTKPTEPTAPATPTSEPTNTDSVPPSPVQQDPAPEGPAAEQDEGVSE
ncbi:MAG TPA: hypothetical protein VFV52_01515 [Bacilli bacterium]|nr:hypothetical protein [Bacilli bacterium]